MRFVMNNQDFETARKSMVNNQIVNRGVDNLQIIDAMLKIPREKFISQDREDFAYWDGPVSIGKGQTISQPYIVALMIQALDIKKTDKILEIGTGSGYNAAVMSELADEVHSVEVVDGLYQEVQGKLKSYSNVFVYHSDGHNGLPQVAPFDKIILTAAPNDFPSKLWNQLKEDGILVAPLGEEGKLQKLFSYQKIDGRPQESFLADVRFVPMVRKTES